jgi:hypothetical protein
MNKRYVYLLSALMISGLMMAQKKELKDAEKAVKKGNAVEANAALKSVEAVLGSATNEQKAQYYALKGNLAYAQHGGAEIRGDPEIKRTGPAL